MLAIYDNDVEKFKSLINSGVDVNFISPGKKGFKLTALEVAIRKNKRSCCCRASGTNRIFKPAAMLKIAVTESSGANVEIIIKYRDNLNDTNGFSVLMRAANSGSKDVVATLLTHGANPKQFRRPDRINALTLAVLSGDKN